MTTQIDVYLKFLADAWDEEQYNKLHKACGSVEHIERAFEIEFSCGDGRYLNDDLSDEELAKHDGNVCLDSPPRFADTLEPLKLNKPYRFTINIARRQKRLCTTSTAKKYPENGLVEQFIMGHSNYKLTEEQKVLLNQKVNELIEIIEHKCDEEESLELYPEGKFDNNKFTAIVWYVGDKLSAY